MAFSTVYVGPFPHHLPKGGVSTSEFRVEATDMGGESGPALLDLARFGYDSGNEAGRSELTRGQVVELRDALTAWLDETPADS